MLAAVFFIPGAYAEFKVEAVTQSGESAALVATEGETLDALRAGEPVALYGEKVVRGKILEKKEAKLFVMSEGARFEIGDAFHSLQSGEKTVSRRFGKIRNYKNSERYQHFDVQRQRLQAGINVAGRRWDAFSALDANTENTSLRATTVSSSFEVALKPTWIVGLQAIWIPESIIAIQTSSGGSTAKGSIRSGFGDPTFLTRIHLASVGRDLVALAAVRPSLYSTPVSSGALSAEAGLGWGKTWKNLYPFAEAIAGKQLSSAFGDPASGTYERGAYSYYRAKLGSEFHASRDAVFSADAFYGETGEITYDYADKSTLIFPPQERYGLETSLYLYRDEKTSFALNGAYFRESDQDVNFTWFAARGKSEGRKYLRGFEAGLTMRLLFN